MELDTMSSGEIVRLMNREDFNVAAAVKEAVPEIARTADQVADCIRNGGRLFYTGAGTSGRLGILDASEWPPTFGVAPGTAVGLIAGGRAAVTSMVEDAEDDSEAGKNDLISHGLTAADMVIGIAASGNTPYVCGALEYAKSLGCRTASVSCCKGGRIGEIAGISIEVDAGPEVLTGSTRLKAGTATKMILNMISTAAMVRLGKVYENLMVNVIQSNQKLRGRTVRIVSEATGEEEEKAKEALTMAGGNARTAIVMLMTGYTREEAEKALTEKNGSIRRVREDYGRK